MFLFHFYHFKSPRNSMKTQQRKEIPPEAFIPTPQRILAIIQLSIAFSALLWFFMQPFMGEYFTLRSRMLPYEYIMGTSPLLKKDELSGKKLERNSNRFQTLSDDQQQILLMDYRELSDYASRPAIQKIVDGAKVVLLTIPPFEFAWIVFSIIISILILLKYEGARAAAWLLPLIVIAYSLDNQLTGYSVTAPDTSLFPSEERVLREYLEEPLATSPLKQKEQLERGWKNYLIREWSGDVEGTYEQKVEEGEFYFTLERLNLMHGQPRSEWLNTFHERLNPLILLLFLVWNLFFAYSMSLKTTTPAK